MIKVNLYETIDLTYGSHLTDDEIYDVYENFIIVKRDDKYGICYLTSKRIDHQEIDFKYNYIQETENGMFIIDQGNLYGLLNQKGEEIVKPQYDDIHDTKDGFFHIELNEKEGLMDLEGNVVLDPIYQNIDCFGGEYAIVTKYNKKGVINRKGEEVLECDYVSFEIFDNKYVIDNHSVIDLNKKEMIIALFDKILYLGNDQFLISRNHRFKIVDSGNNTIKKIQSKKSRNFYQLELLNNGLLYSRAFWAHDTSSLMDQEGNRINNFKSYEEHDDSEFIIVYNKIDGYQYTLYNSQGNCVLKNKYHNISYCSPGLYILHSNSGDGLYIGSSSKEIEPIYNRIWDYETVFVAENKNNKYGFITLQGEVLNGTFIYDYITRDNCTFIGIIGSKKYLLNDKGELLNSYAYDDFMYFASDGLTLLERDNTKVLLHRSGKEIAQKEFSYYGVLDNGYIYGWIRPDNILKRLYSLYDENGKVIFEDKLMDSLRSYNKNQLIIDNHLISIDDIKTKYLIEIINNNQTTWKEFENINQRQEYLNHFNKYYIEQINEWLNKQKKLIEKQDRERKDQIHELCDIIPDDGVEHLNHYLDFLKHNEELKSNHQNEVNREAKQLIKKFENEEYKNGTD